MPRTSADSPPGSNVYLASNPAAGRRHHRRVELDGASVAAPVHTALGVMMPGEVNAPAPERLPPRATLPPSLAVPVLRLPVQTMDPASRRTRPFTGKNRVARQLANHPRNRSAHGGVRHLSIRSLHPEVTRRAWVSLQVRVCLDPVEQALRDAAALAADGHCHPEWLPASFRYCSSLPWRLIHARRSWRHHLLVGRRQRRIEDDPVEAALVRLNLLPRWRDWHTSLRAASPAAALKCLGHRFSRSYQTLNPVAPRRALR